jgi:S1-C subfamily serine protease
MTRLLLPAVAFLALAGAAAAQPQALPAEQLKKIKAATVFVKVAFGNLEGSGSGFVVHAAKDYGLVVTNEHVISPPQPRAGFGRFPPPPGFPGRPPMIGGGGKPSVEVVFNSGTPTEWSVKADILYENKADDLALLKVRALKPIPDPLALTGADKLPETTPVYVCGFPFGDALAEGAKNPEISIGVASVSSNRLDGLGNVVTVQLNGALNPGNSGGPVVTQEGKLVGVAVKTVTGAGIGFAVPPAKVRSAVQDVHFTVPAVTFIDGPPKKVRLESKMVDALGRNRRLEVHVAAASNITPPAEVSKLPTATVLAPVMKGDLVTAEFTPFSASHFWVQFVWTDGSGKVSRNTPLRLAAETQRTTAPNPLAARPTPRPAPGGSPQPFVDGKQLPPLARDLGPTPAGQMDVDELNRKARDLTGKDLTIDILTTGSSAGWGDGPSLSGYNRNKQMPGGLDFVVDRTMADQMTALRVSGFLAVRLKGKPQRSAAQKPWELFVVEEIGLLAADGTVAATFKRGAAVAAPQSPPTPQRGFDTAGEIRRYQEFRTNPQATVGRTYQHGMYLTGVNDEVVRVGNRDVAVKRLNVTDRLGRAIREVKLYAEPVTGEKIQAAFKADGRVKVMAQITFQPLRAEANGADCGVTEISFFDDAYANRGWTEKGPLPDLFPPPAAVPVVANPPAPQPELVPNRDAMVPANGDPALRAPGEKRPALPPGEVDEEGGSKGLMIGLLVVVLLVIAGGVAWGVLGGRKPPERSAGRSRMSDSGRRRPPVARRDADDDDERPRRHRRED